MKFMTTAITIGLATATLGQAVTGLRSNDASITKDGVVFIDGKAQEERKKLSLVTLDSGKPKDSAEYRLEPKAANAFKTLREKAKAKGYDLIILSAFRSFGMQNYFFFERIKNKRIMYPSYGDVRKPGHSIFQTGRAIYVQIKDENKREDGETWLKDIAKTYQFCQRSWKSNKGMGVILHYNPDGQKCDPLVRMK
jgi:LAS superfamily LD-carboxypeptidase LdcB